MPYICPDILEQPEHDSTLDMTEGRSVILRTSFFKGERQIEEEAKEGL